MTAATPGERLARRVAETLPDLREGVSRFNPKHVAWFAGRKEIAHLHSGTSFDARVPKAEQRGWKDDPRLVPRKSASPWMEITLATDADVEDALRLVRLAAESAGT